ncbi:MAG: PrsW family glutamic-type intramembrane protease [Candidatus Paceibacterota bacterium]
MALLIPFSIILSYLPIYYWIKFFLEFDKEKPEPFYWLSILFLSGIASAPFVYYSQNIFKGNENLILLIGSALEEFFKLIIPLLILKKNRYFDEAIDGMVYFIMFGLGFAFVENIGVVFKELVLENNFSSAVSYLFFRFLGANLFHALSSAILGYFFIQYLIKRKRVLLLKGLSFSIIFHWSFNFLILNFSFLTFLITLIIFSLTIGLILKYSKILKNIRQPIKHSF